MLARRLTLVKSRGSYVALLLLRSAIAKPDDAYFSAARLANLTLR